LRPNPSKTQICLYHHDNRQATARFNLEWDNVRLERSTHPIIPGIALDRTLTYRRHVDKAIRWGANRSVLRTSALALIFSTAGYAVPVWSGSTYVQNLDAVLNDTYRTITGRLKHTNQEHLFMLSGIIASDVRCSTA
ncbi:hypothetical protein Trydic_g6106, partial [Trypoxylus dichotomus]